MRSPREVAVGALLSLAMSGCCFGGGGAKTTDVATATTSKAKMADPSKVKAVKKVAIASIFAECDIRNETEKGGVWAAAGAISGAKNQDAMRTPMTLDLAAPAFAEEVAKSSGWTVIPHAEMTANPAYAEKTFPADLREQVKVTRKALGCAGGGYRVVTENYADQVGALAMALGVDAVILAQFDTSLKYETRGVNATGTMWANANIVVMGADGSLLFRDRLSTKSDDTMPMPAGKLDWTKVPPLGPSALRNAAKKFSEDLKKATAAP